MAFLATGGVALGLRLGSHKHTPVAVASSTIPPTTRNGSTSTRTASTVPASTPVTTVPTTAPTSTTSPVQLDTTSPAPALTDPANAYVDTATPTFAGIAGNDSGDSATVTVFILDSGQHPAGGSPLQTQRDGNRFTVTVPDSDPLPDGAYSADVVQTDDAGNTGTSSPISFTVDTTDPIVFLSCPVKLSFCTGKASELDQPVTVTTTDEGPIGGPLTPGASTTQTVDVAKNQTFTVTPDTPLQGEVYHVVASQTDAAGNFGESKTVPVTT